MIKGKIPIERNAYYHMIKGPSFHRALAALQTFSTSLGLCSTTPPWIPCKGVIYLREGRSLWLALLDLNTSPAMSHHSTGI